VVRSPSARAGRTRGRLRRGTACDLDRFWANFYGLATSLGFPDLDGAAIRTSEPRELTQQISRFLWERTPHDGVLFESRFGNRLKLYAIFERPSTSSLARGRSKLVSGTSHKLIPSISRDLTRALALHKLTIDEGR
jgi:hypothetical protein